MSSFRLCIPPQVSVVVLVLLALVHVGLAVGFKVATLHANILHCALTIELPPLLPLQYYYFSSGLAPSSSNGTAR